MMRWARVERRALARRVLWAVALSAAVHAIVLGLIEPPDAEPMPRADWPTLDADVWGGNYSNHHGNGPTTQVSVAKGAAKHPILKGVDAGSITSLGSLYVVRPLG
ncbi:MAG: hypothetical protein R3357_10590, partial [Burkholderiales bacterium]|nr:hypothetical protein [Burkholderiales bacterium]